MIRFENVTKLYPRQEKAALDGVNLEIAKGEFVFLVGLSGSGKSTFLRLVLREERPTTGVIHVAGKDLNTLANHKVPELRRQVGTVYQDFRLLPNKTVSENVAFTLHVLGYSNKQISREVPEVLELVGLEEKVQKLKDDNKVKLITPAEVTELHGQDFLESIVVSNEGKIKTITTDYFIPLFGLTPKLGPIADWGLEIEKNAIKVNNSLDYQTNIPGIYAIGDVNTYAGKLKLILCGFHEATLMCQSAFQRIYPDKKNILKYTTVSGISGFDGSRKEAKKSTIKAIK